MNEMCSEKFHAAIVAIDQRNAKDPNRDDDSGQAVPKELLYSQRLTRWVEKLTDHPSEELLLAARAQHIGRWHWPRQNYPNGREGYLQWRQYLQKFHAETLATIMQQAEFGQESIDQACDLILKKNFSKNPQGQILEDAICLVFLQFELAKFSVKIEKNKAIGILQKTWKKMSPSAQQVAQTLKLAENEMQLLQTALNS